DLLLSINSIGDNVCRPVYLEELRSYYAAHSEEVCEDCTRRLERNPLRLLDCKNQQCQPLIENAPVSSDHLCPECQDHWDNLRAYLTEIGLDYQVERRLVRGLDYYSRTVFEIAPPEEGRMVTIVGGGRYDGLIEELGGRSTPGIGYGMGLERVIQNIQRQNIPVPDEREVSALVVHLGEAAKSAGIRIASGLRRAGIAASLAPPRGMRSQLRYASNTGATHAIIIGDDELEKGVATLRDLDSSSQSEVPLDRLAGALR
ncbi:MAG: ATP phosphoribosyltransferase regulatory subunit, partial [Gammaproteobacteria bacterium]|nr:ATP phosphoribosyltransferase regulatory subunit [Gammaproteobacteria bacterium]